MIDFACVSSTTPTWSNDPRWCTLGIAATEAEHGKLAADRASSAQVQGVHRYYPFVVEDRGRLGKSALTVVYIFSVLLAGSVMLALRPAAVAAAAGLISSAAAAADCEYEYSRPAAAGSWRATPRQERLTVERIARPEQLGLPSGTEA
eukprot:jgi/Tetstr1/429704/TSEL_019599.t1